MITQNSINWLLFDRSGKIEMPVATFIPEVLTKIEVCTALDTKQHVQLWLHFQVGQATEVSVSLSKLERIDWFDLDNRCLINSNYRKAREYLTNIIRLGLLNARTEKQYLLEKLGIQRVEDNIVFVAGDRVITRSSDNTSKLDIKSGMLPFKLDIDPNINEKEAFEGMKKLISLSPEIGRVLVSHVISGITRTAFKEAGITPCAVLVIVGKTGMLKSNYVPHLVQLYNRKDEIKASTRFNSTQRFIEDILYDYAECTAVIDDLHTAESKGIKKINEATAEEIIRRIGDDTGRGHKEGNTLVQKKFRGNAVFIGEYTIGKESTVPRALVVNITKPPDGGILDKYQRHQPLLASTFYYYFIEWYVENFKDIREVIDKRLTNFRETSTTGIHLRLKDTQFYLQISYMLFLEFCKNSNFITETEAQDEYIDFGNQLLKLIREQQDRIKPDEVKPVKINYLKLIRKLYKNKIFRLAENVEQFDRDKHDGLLYYECLCLRGEKLDKRIRKEIGGFSHNTMITDLIFRNALKLTSDKRTVQIRHLNGLRFYAIWLDILD